MATTVTLKPNAIDLSGSTSGTTTLQATAVAGTTTITLPAATDTLVGKATTDTLTNKTLTSPTINGATIATGTINNTTIGATTATTGAFTSITASTTLTATGAGSIEGLTVGRGGGASSLNVALGLNALAANSGTQSVAVGRIALAGNTTGNYNTAVGSDALYANTTGSQNTAVGMSALITNTTASNNTGLGVFALYLNTTGANNTAVGTSALQANTTASNNTAVGYQAAYSNTTGASNTILGHSAGYSSTVGNSNVLIGQNAGYTNTGSGNTLIGQGAGQSATNAGANNTVVGQAAGNVNTGGSNSFFGRGAGNLNTSGSVNSFFGFSSGSAVTTGASNVIIGGYSGSAAPISATGSNYIVLSDGDGVLRYWVDNSGFANQYIPANTGGGFGSGNSVGYYLTLNNSSSAITQYAGIFGSIKTSTAGSEDGQFVIGVKKAGTMTYPVLVDSSGIVTMNAYGAGAATFSAAGVISSVSDETWKIKDGAPVDTDSMLKKLEPGYWYYNDEKKETFGAERQLGFYAQNVNAAIGPEAAPAPEEGKPWGYYDRSVLAVTVMSLQKALATIESLTARIAALETQ